MKTSTDVKIIESVRDSESIPLFTETMWWSIELFFQRRCYCPGKNRDGWWTNADLVQQLEEVMSLFEAIHPDCELLFCFDNSQNHHARKPNALWVHNMNLNDGGKHLRATTWNGVPQSLQYDDGKQKGIRTILTERQLWVPGLKLMCQPCRQHDPPDDNLTCCARRVLSDCPDFQEDCCWLEETLKARNHKLIFFPKIRFEGNCF